MRKSTIPVAVAIIAAFSLPAHAAKYTCTFSQAGNPVGQPCVIDPTTTNTSCQQPFGSNLTAICAAGASDDDKVEGLLCLFGVPASATEITKGLMGQDPAKAVRTLAEKPGFFAQNITIFPTQARPTAEALFYRESQNSPVLGAVCN